MRFTKHNIALLCLTVFGCALLMGCQTTSSASIQQLRTAAERGDAEAQYELGNAYFYGRGVPQDYQQAQNWYDKAAASYQRQ